MPRVLVLQHADWELPGCYGDVLATRKAQVQVVRPDLGEPLPDWRSFDAILAMGGPMSVNDEADLPWLTEEKALIRAAVAADTPYFGACLGAQLLASALGARVYPGTRPEYGMHPVRISPAALTDPVFAGLPAELEVFQWHGETFDLPPDAMALAVSADHAYQAIRAGARAYGLQFHLEVSSELLDTWLAVPACVAEIRRELGAGAEDQLVKELELAEVRMLALARRVFGRWLDLVDG